MQNISKAHLFKSVGIIPLIFGARGLEPDINIGTWNDRYVTARTFVGWSGYTAGGAHILLHGYFWKNSRPANEIRDIVFSSQKTALTPILFAITLQQRDE